MADYIPELAKANPEDFGIVQTARMADVVALCGQQLTLVEDL